MFNYSEDLLKGYPQAVKFTIESWQDADGFRRNLAEISTSINKNRKVFLGAVPEKAPYPSSKPVGVKLKAEDGLSGPMDVWIFIDPSFPWEVAIEPCTPPGVPEGKVGMWREALSDWKYF